MLQAEHLDEGTLHAWLDGELDSDQMADVEHHLEDCAECHARAEEARTMLHDADELVERLDPPPFVVLPEARSMGGGGFGEPVVLMPPEPEMPRPVRPFAPPGISRRWKITGLAAGLAAVLGVGYLLTQGGEPSGNTALARAESDQATVAEFERSATEQGGRGTQLDRAGTPESVAQPRTPAGLADEAAPGAAPDAAALAARSADGDVSDEAADEPVLEDAPETQELAVQSQRAADPTPPARQVERRRETAQPVTRAPAQTQAARTPPRPDARAGAAAAAAERDVSERTQEILETSAESAAAPPPAPEPAADATSALERRAGVYSRIGLDEAQRMLGTPAHAIADMRPQFIGLAPSNGVPGADQGRPLVRVVYLDQAQRLILLDQQRQSGELPQGNGNMIVMARGGVRLWLHGAVPPATLRALADRVR